MPLFVKKLDPRAITPTCAHPGEDLAYDLYALEDTVVYPYAVRVVRTGVALEHRRSIEYIGIDSCTYYRHVSDGLLIRDRSSMALKGLFVVGGVVDAGYTGEVSVQMTRAGQLPYDIKAGDKIAQVIPVPVLTSEDVVVVEEIYGGKRGAKGFGSSGR